MDDISAVLARMEDKRLQAGWLGVRGARAYVGALEAVEGNEVHAEVVGAIASVAEDMLHLAMLGAVVAQAVANGDDAQQAAREFAAYKTDDTLAEFWEQSEARCDAQRAGYHCGLPRDHADPLVHAAMTDTGLMAAWHEEAAGVRVRKPAIKPPLYVEMICSQGHLLHLYENEYLRADTPDGLPCPSCYITVKERNEQEQDAAG